MSKYEKWNVLRLDKGKCWHAKVKLNIWRDYSWVLLYLINLGILPWCAEPWNDTRFMSKVWYRCQASKANWWINDVYSYLNLTFKKKLISNCWQTNYKWLTEWFFYTTSQTSLVVVYLSKPHIWPQTINILIGCLK